MPDAKDNPCPNYSSLLLPGADGLTVLEVACKFEGDKCQAFYRTATLPTPAKAALRERCYYFADLYTVC